jgi:hypothetical protein
VKTAAQAVLASLGGDALSLYEVNPGTALGIAGGAALLSLLTSIASKPIGPDKDSASTVE